MKCAILDDYQHVALGAADWSPLEGQVGLAAFHEHFASETELVRALAGYDVVVIMRERTPFTASVFEALPSLKLLITSGMRNGAIDLAAAERCGVTVCGTASSSDPPAELTWALLMALARSVVDEATALRRGEVWQSTLGTDLRGKTLGLIGLGKIGSRVARFGRAFDMRVVAWSPNLTRERAVKEGAELAPSLEALLRAADFASIHLVLGGTTRRLVGATQLACMKPTARLINTSRAPIVDGAALVTALRSGALAGAAVDVFEVEPLPADSEWRTTPRLLATPHLGYVSEANYSVYFREAVEDILAFRRGEPTRVLKRG